MMSLDESRIHHLVAASKNGSRSAREALLQQLEPFALRQAQQVCHHPVDRSDDAFSIALLALNETVDAYDPSRGASFTAFARTVIRRRVIDHLRSEQRHRHLPLEPVDGDAGGRAPLEHGEAAKRHEFESDRQFLASQLEDYKEALRQFDLDIRTLIEATPRRRDARERLQRAAAVLAADRELYAQLLTTGRLPLQALSRRLPVSRKTLERGRIYIIGTALALSDDFPSLQQHLSAVLRGWEA